MAIAAPAAVRLGVRDLVVALARRPGGLGSLADVFGVALQTLALGWGSVVLVQPLLVTAADFSAFVQGGTFAPIRRLRFSAPAGQEKFWREIAVEITADVAPLPAH